jgi:microcystin-dependent protein
MAFLNIAPTGTVLPFAGSTAPEGWLLCNGASQSTTTYAKLFAVIGYTYGGTGGSFSLPDMQGVFPRGAGTNLTANYGGLAGHTPAGGALANKGRQKTGINGLSNASSSLSSGVSSVNKNLWNANQTSHVHAQSGTDVAGTNTGWRPAHGFGSLTTVTSTLGEYASWTSNQALGTATGTADAQTISSTDSETTPAFLALNYIIKA